MSLTEDEELTKQAYDRLAKAWSNAHLTAGYWGKGLDEFHQLLPNGELLEIGCGGGRDAKELIALGYNYLGTDISAELLKEAKKNNPGATFQQVSLYDLDFAEPFDGFWCAAVLLHIPKQRISEALQAIKRSVKKGGIGFITVKEGDGEKIETDDELDGDGRLFVYWQNAEFKQVLARNGFEILQESYIPKSERTKWLTYHIRIL